MSKVWARGLAAALLAAVVIAGVAATGCSRGGAASAASDSSSHASPSTILGHEPTGLARTILDRGTLIVANDSDYPPQSSIDEKTGDLVGFDVDVAKKVGQLLGLKVQFVHPPWETVASGLRKGQFDVSIDSMAVSDSAAERVAFTEPYYYTRAQVFMRKGDQSITGIQALDGRAVAVAAATTFYDFLTSSTNATVKMFDTDADAFAALEAGTVDYAVSSDVAGQGAISSGAQIAFSGKPLYYESRAFAVKKRESDWLAILDYVVGKMHQDGSLTGMSRTWFYGVDLSIQR
jgi:polar amino acid transport system substrate-binding protein